MCNMPALASGYQNTFYEPALKINRTGRHDVYAMDKPNIE